MLTTSSVLDSFSYRHRITECWRSTVIVGQANVTSTWIGKNQQIFVLVAEQRRHLIGTRYEYYTLSAADGAAPIGSDVRTVNLKQYLTAGCHTWKLLHGTTI
jgi:hypothetical protein